MSDSIVSDESNRDFLFTTLVTEYKDKIYRLAGRFFKERVDREDVVQETFLRVYSSLNRFDNTKNVSAWIYRIGTNICIDTLRRKSIRRTVTLLPNSENDPIDVMDTFPNKDGGPEDIAVKNELRRMLEHIINDLPPKWKPLIYQYYILDMSLEELSKANGMPVSTIKSRLFRARSYLQRKFHLQSMNNEH